MISCASLRSPNFFFLNTFFIFFINFVWIKNLSWINGKTCLTLLSQSFSGKSLQYIGPQNKSHGSFYKSSPITTSSLVRLLRPSFCVGEQWIASRQCHMTVDIAVSCLCYEYVIWHLEMFYRNVKWLIKIWIKKIFKFFHENVIF